MAEIQKSNNHPAELTKDMVEPHRAQPVSWWWFVTALTAALILGLGSIILIRDLARILSILILGISIANALAPVVNFLEHNMRIPRAAAILIVFLLLVLIFALILYITIPVLVSQVKNLFQNASTWVPQVISWLAQFGFDRNTLLNSFSSMTSTVGSLLISLPSAIFNSLLDFVLVIFISLYWLILMNGMRRFFLTFFQHEDRDRVENILQELGKAMGGYLRGAAIDGLIFGAFKYVGLLIIGVPYALTLGVIAASLEFFPTIGAIISATIASLVALSISPTLALITLGYTIVLQQAENHILVPLVMRSQTSISPLLAVLAVVSGGAIGGILGAVVGIPIVSAADVLIRMVIGPAIRRANGVVLTEEERKQVHETEETEKEEAEEL